MADKYTQGRRLIDFALANNFYLIPFEPQTKKPLTGFAWADFNLQDLQSEFIALSQELDQAKNPQDQQRIKEKIRQNLYSYDARLDTMDLNIQLKGFRYAQINYNRIKHNPKTDKTIRHLIKCYLTASEWNFFAVKCNKSKLLVIDCDTEDHNQETSTTPQSQCYGLDCLIQWFNACNLDLSLLTNTLTVRTASGGYHFIFKYSGNDIKKSVDCLNKVDISPLLPSGVKKSVDLICGNNVFIAPYSIKNKGGQDRMYQPIKMLFDSSSYQVQAFKGEPITPISELPRELETALKGIQATTATKTFNHFDFSNIDLSEDRSEPSTKQTRHARNIYKKLIEELSKATEGQRHNKLLSISYSIGTYMHYLDLTRESIIFELSTVASRLGLDANDIKQTISDGMKYGMTKQKILPL